MNIRKLNKKGQETNPIAVVAGIILILLVLALLIFGFTFGWANAWTKFKTYTGFGDKANIDEIVTSCKIACDTQRASEYTVSKKEVIFDDGFKVSLTCQQLQAPIGACLKDSKLVNGITKQEDCEAAGTWMPETCQLLDPVDPKDIKKATYVLANAGKCAKGQLTTNVCVKADKTGSLSLKEADCSAKGTWNSNYKSAVILEGCNSFSLA